MIVRFSLRGVRVVAVGLVMLAGCAPNVPVAVVPPPAMLVGPTFPRNLMGMNADVVATCRVAVDGTARVCRIMHLACDRVGLCDPFAQSALRFLVSVKHPPLLVKGQPVDGEKTFKIGFRSVQGQHGAAAMCRAVAPPMFNADPPPMDDAQAASFPNLAGAAGPMSLVPGSPLPGSPLPGSPLPGLAGREAAAAAIADPVPGCRAGRCGTPLTLAGGNARGHDTAVVKLGITY